MKYYILILAFAFSTFAAAQRPENHEKLTPSQRATLQAKKMQLDLELTDRQVSPLVEIFKNYPRPEHSKKSGEQTPEANYQKHLERLDRQLALQKEIKSVLNEAQFQTWKSRQHSKKNRMAQHHGKRPMSAHRSKKH